MSLLFNEHVDDVLALLPNLNALALEVLFEDNHLLAVNKPAGLATQPSEHNEQNLEDQAKAYIKIAYQKPGNVYLHPLHRLDKPASGIVLFAKTSKSLSRLQEAMRGQELKKIYWAIVEGKVVPEEGTLKHRLAHESHRATVCKDGKEALLHYKVIDHIKSHSVVEIELQTGRYHQIRAQFSAIGHPVVGDTKYGAKTKLAKEAIALHHMQLEFSHPVTKEPIVIVCPAPKVLL